MNTAAPMAKGVAMIADRNVTMNEPAIIGNAHYHRFAICPYLSWIPVCAKQEIKHIDFIDKEGC